MPPPTASLSCAILPAATPLPPAPGTQNKNVDEENRVHLGMLPGSPTNVDAVDLFKGDYAADVRTRLMEMIEKKAAGSLPLKVGAQVILTKNMPQYNLVNGSRGIVQRIVTKVGMTHEPPVARSLPCMHILLLRPPPAC